MKNQIKQLRKLAAFVAFAATVGILLNACHKTGPLTKEEIPLDGEIKSVFIDGPWDVVIEQNSGNNSAVIEYNVPKDKIVAYYYNNNGHLLIRVSSVGNYRNVVLRAKIAAASLENIEASGAATIETYGQFQNATDISLTGASKLKGFSCEGEFANIILSGASKLEPFSFKGKRLEAVISGASVLNLRKIDVDYCTVNASGASYFLGNGFADRASFVGSGASTFSAFNVGTANLDIDLSGASYAEVNASQTIKGRLTGASTLKYRDIASLQVQVEVDGDSKIKRE